MDSVWVYPDEHGPDWTEYELGLVDLRQTCCTGDCPRVTVGIVVPNKRQTTSPVDTVPSGINGLIDLDDKTRAWLKNNGLDISVVSDGTREKKNCFHLAIDECN